MSRSRENFDEPMPSFVCPLDQRFVCLVGPQNFRPLDLAAKHFQRQSATVAILHASRRNDQRPQESERIDDHVPLAAGHLFFPRRSRVARLARWSSHFGCRGSQPTVWAFCPPCVAPARATPRESAPTCRRAATGESNETQSDKVGSRVANSATCSHCA